MNIQAPTTVPGPDTVTAPLMQRVAGTGRLAAARRDGTTVLRDLYQDGAAKIRIPRHHDGTGMEAVLINTAGGLTGGDRLRWDIAAGDDTRLTLTTQACEKVYKAVDDTTARVEVRLEVGHDAVLAWMPQETILFDGARMTRSIEADLAPGARLLAVEATVFGRTARSEEVRRLLFADRWRIRQGGALVHGEDMRIDGDARALLGKAAAAAGGGAVATVLLAGADAADKADAARRLLDGVDGVSAGVSGWSVAGTGKLLARLVASDDYALRKALVPLLALLNSEAAVPKIWSI